MNGNIDVNVNVYLYEGDHDEPFYTVHNVTTNAAASWLAQLASGSSVGALSRCSIGSGTLDPAVTDVALGNQEAIIDLFALFPAGGSIRAQAYFRGGSIPYNITEIGLMAGTNGDILFARTLVNPSFDNTNPSTRRDLRVLWEVTISPDNP